MSGGWISTSFGLLAALTWGAGDFSGGLAARRGNAYGVVIISHIASMMILLTAALVMRSPLPPLESFLWGGAAGLGGGFGLLLLYSALASGRMSVAAPVSALVAAGIPVVVTSFSEGLPGWLVITGFALALCAIWLISASNTQIHLADLRMPIGAGAAFGLFFLCLHQASVSSIIFPLIAVRIVSISSLLIFAFITRQSILPSRKSILPTIASGLLDTIGNGAFALASQTGRMDIAAVLGSLYPGSTVLLAMILLKERISRGQIIGILAGLLAIILIAL